MAKRKDISWEKSERKRPNVIGLAQQCFMYSIRASACSEEANFTRYSNKCENFFPINSIRDIWGERDVPAGCNPKIGKTGGKNGGNGCPGGLPTT
jgi:hypothetical protein